MNKKISAILGVIILTSISNIAFAEELPPSVTTTSTEVTAEPATETETEANPESTTETNEESSATEATPELINETEENEESEETVEAAFKDFEDVSVDHPYYNAIIVLRYQGVLEGYSDNTFHPEQPLNRVEALKLVFEVAKIDISNGIAPAEFSDIEENAWYRGYLNKAVYLEVVSGYADGTFKPEQSVNLVEFLKMLLLAQKADLDNAVLAQIPYADVMPGQWYSKYINYAKIKDLLKTDEDNNVFPAESLTRARAADIIYRFRNMESVKIESGNSNSEEESTTPATIVPVKDFALYVSQGWHFGIQYPKTWYYSSFIDKVDENDIAIYGFGPDDLSTNDPLVTLELLPNDETFEANLLYDGFSYAEEVGTDDLVHLVAKIDGSSRVYRLNGPASQKTNMLNMLSSLTADIDGLESYNPAEATTEESTEEEVTTEEETAPVEEPTPAETEPEESELPPSTV